MTGSFSPLLVLLAVLLAAAASYATLDLASRLGSVGGRVRTAWIASGSIAIGTGIWAMHFVGMLAFRLHRLTPTAEEPIPIAYDLSLLLASVIVAMFAALIALLAVSRERLAAWQLALASLVMGAVLSGTHFLGMASMHMAANVTYRPMLVLAAGAVAVAASFGAIWLGLQLRGEDGGATIGVRLMAALVVGLAIAGMHFTAMAAARFTPGAATSTAMSAPARAALSGSDALAWIVTGATLLMIGLALAGSMVDRRVRRRLAVASEHQRLHEEMEVARGESEEANELLQRQAVEMEQQMEEAQALAEELEQTNVLLQQQATALEDARDAAESSRKRMTTIFDSVTDAVAACDRSWHITYANPVAREMSRVLGADPMTMLGRDTRELFPILRGTMFETEMECALRDGQKREFEQRFAPLGVWVESRMVPTADGVVVFIRDITARKRRELTDRFLASASVALTGSLEYARTLQTLAELAIADLADGCAVRVRGENGAMALMAIASRDPQKVELIREIETRYEPASDGAAGYSRVLHTGESQVWSNVTPDALDALTSDAAQREMIRALDMHSALLVPIVGRNEILGVITLVGHGPTRERRLGRQELAVAEELGRRAGLAIENARAYEDTERARGEAERAADRARRLQSVASALSHAATPEAVADVVTRYGLDAIDADGGSLAILDRNGEEFIVVSSIGYGAQTMRRFGRFPIDDRKPVSHAVLHGDAVFIESLDDAERRYPSAANGLRDAGHEAYAAIPIVCAERAVGGLTLSFREPRPFPAADRQFLATLGVLAGQALERAELFARTEAARQRSELLAETSRLLASSLDYEATFESLTRLTVPALADWCTADMLTESGEVELLAVAHIDPAKVEWARELRRRNPPGPDAPTGVRAVLRTGEAEMVAVVTDAMLVAAAKSAEELALLRGLGFRSYICVPMIARGRVLGALTLITTNESNRHYTPEDLSLANELAQRAAVAIDNARLHRASERARAEAEAANASKGQFLATMSHELRTPLNAISGYAELMQLEVHGPVTPQQHEDLERIKRSQRHLLSMVNDVLNFARLEAGSVQFDIDSFLVDEVLRTSQSLVGPQLRSRQLVYDYLPGSAMLMVRADRDKLQQIVLNLLSNAVKFTDHGGRITLAAEAEGDRVCIRVSDTGRGIPAEELEKIFEPFVQVDRGLTRTTEGTGLGLSISRDLARTMAGDLRVASEVGVGSTFTLSLPRG